MNPSVLAAVASQFHQDFDLENRSARETVASVVESLDRLEREQLRGEVIDLLAFETEKDRRHYLNMLGAAYWPVNEPISEVFGALLKELGA